MGQSLLTHNIAYKKLLSRVRHQKAPHHLCSIGLDSSSITIFVVQGTDNRLGKK